MIEIKKCLSWRNKSDSELYVLYMFEEGYLMRALVRMSFKL